MKNELKINRLIEYQVVFDTYNEEGVAREEDRFTADEYEVMDSHGRRIRFKRTGNVIREYFICPRMIIGTPVEEE